MSLKALAWAWDKRGLGTDARLTLLGLANYLNMNDVTTFPLVRTLALDCDLSERSVRRAMAKLEAADLIWRLPTARRGEQTSNSVVLNLRDLGQVEWVRVVDAEAQRLRFEPQRQGRVVYRRASRRDPIRVPKRGTPMLGEQPELPIGPSIEELREEFERLGVLLLERPSRRRPRLDDMQITERMNEVRLLLSDLGEDVISSRGRSA